MNNASDEMKIQRDIGQSMEEKYKKRRRINSAQIIYHAVSHVIGKYCWEDTLRRFKIKEDKMNVKISL